MFCLYINNHFYVCMCVRWHLEEPRILNVCVINILSPCIIRQQSFSSMLILIVIVINVFFSVYYCSIILFFYGSSVCDESLKAIGYWFFSATFSVPMHHSSIIFFFVHVWIIISLLYMLHVCEMSPVRTLDVDR